MLQNNKSDKTRLVRLTSEALLQLRLLKKFYKKSMAQIVTDLIAEECKRLLLQKKAGRPKKTKSE